MNYNSLRNMLFLLPAEASHHLSLQAIGLAEQLKLAPLLAREPVVDPVEVMGIRFPNRVGLAAGLDKDGKYVQGLAAMGFGFVEVGTVTPQPQAGNPKPRMFRLPSKGAIINRMGFNNDGVDAMVRRLRRVRFEGVLGINIGKNAVTPLEDTLSDYVTCLRRVYKLASYIVVNISSPNTQGLRRLQHGDELARLLEGLRVEHKVLAEKYGRHVPLAVKIAPDMDDEELNQVLARLMEFELDGVIVSNTTVSRTGLEGERHAGQQGGLSGAPLKKQSDHVLAATASRVKGKLGIIGVGGVMSGADAADKIRLGADLVQIYTGFIYAGPDLIAEAGREILALRE